SAAPLMATAPGDSLGSTARTAGHHAVATAHATGGATMVDQLTAAQTQDTAIRPFVVEFSDAKLDDLRQRINATNWPERELVADASQGVQLATTQKLARYWSSDYDLRRVQTKLNALPNHLTEIDGL